ncbi:MAG: hypothetical protein JSV16_08895 [Candidatus Hydrogenedentota bacterium]|nr:MAG: hypothetical protein JSV16_08895 [Candidatus Hydrogenedentota bacterium]
MDTRELKKEFGGDPCFRGGGIDTQEILPHGSAAEVRDEVKRRGKCSTRRLCTRSGKSPFLFGLSDWVTTQDKK